jgi:hypothetical protein
MRGIVFLMPTDDTAHASNWRTILLVDLVLGLIVSAVGVVVLLKASAFLGALLVAAGWAYAVLIARRGRRWRRIRRRAGL